MFKVSPPRMNPTSLQRKERARRAHHISAGLIAALVLANSPLLILSTIDQHNDDVPLVPIVKCMSQKTLDITTVYAGFLIGVLPMLAIFLLSIILVYKVKKCSQAKVCPQVKKNARKLNRTTAVMAAVISITFLILNIPFSIGVLSNFVSSNLLTLEYSILFCVSLINNAINFFLYCLPSKLFRNNLKTCNRPKNVVIQVLPTKVLRQHTVILQHYNNYI